MLLQSGLFRPFCYLISPHTPPLPQQHGLPPIYCHFSHAFWAIPIVNSSHNSSHFPLEAFGEIAKFQGPFRWYGNPLGYFMSIFLFQITRTPFVLLINYKSTWNVEYSGLLGSPMYIYRKKTMWQTVSGKKTNNKTMVVYLT